jgi:hypothetical protein
MPNAIEMFRAQRDAADQVHARLTDVAGLLKALDTQVVALAENRQLRDAMQEEQTLLVRTERLLSQIQYLREQEVSRYWPAVWRRWMLALVFALASAGAAGAGYAWATRTNMASQTPGSPADLADFVARRLATMTSVERRQFDGLLKKLPR